MTKEDKDCVGGILKEGFVESWSALEHPVAQFLCVIKLDNMNGCYKMILFVEAHVDILCVIV